MCVRKQPFADAFVTQQIELLSLFHGRLALLSSIKQFIIYGRYLDFNMLEYPKNSCNSMLALSQRKSFYRAAHPIVCAHRNRMIFVSDSIDKSSETLQNDFQRHNK
ncbi:hypothetical protein F1559_001493 [Cyanidiococcus yangmingshanensis]|uniref:Uncharacterized protein n=1 Tax=Cyanidiococcus yangmingshanensis TaxID=2690220 RepID=A0A7J7ID43_9RHOD|nr:hypothetical protein F1559_001493 [Cyanidiococcus yangmingshanensis]